MNTKNPLREVIEASPLAGTQMVLTAPESPPKFDRPLFFYHVHKTGGNSVKHAIMQNLVHCPEVITGHLGQPLHFDDRNLHQSSAYNPESKSYVNSHFKFGHHEAFREQFRMFTLFRDPVRRLYSDYRYLTHRRGDTPSLPDFEMFFRDPDNICRQCQHLSKRNIHDVGVEEIANDAERTLEILDAYTTTTNIENFLQNLWIGYGYSNVIAEKLNETANIPIDIDLTIFEEELVKLNQYEIDIYEHMRDKPKYMFDSSTMETQRNIVDKIAVLLNGEQKNPDGTTEMQGTCYHMTTQTFFGHMNSGAIKTLGDAANLVGAA